MSSKVFYEVDITAQRPLRDDHASDMSETALVKLDLAIVAVHTDGATLTDTKQKAGRVEAWLLDPYNGDVLDEADAQGDVVAMLAPLVYDEGGEDFHPWWPVECRFGRALAIAGCAMSREHRGKGVELLAVRRLVQLVESHLVVAFETATRVRAEFQKLGFRGVAGTEAGAWAALAGDTSFREAASQGGMFLDPEMRGPINTRGWKGAMGQWPRSKKAKQRKKRGAK